MDTYEADARAAMQVLLLHNKTEYSRTPSDVEMQAVAFEAHKMADAMRAERVRRAREADKQEG